MRGAWAAALLILCAPSAGAAGGGLVEAAMRQAARRAGVALDPGRVRVNLRGEVTVEGLSLEFSGGRVEIPRASGKVDLGGLLKRRLKVEGLRLDRPRIRLRGVKTAPAAVPEEGRWTVTIPLLEAAGGVVELEGAPESIPRRWDLGLLRARYRDDQLEVLSATLVVEGSTATLQGRARLAPEPEADAEISVRGPWTGRARLAGKSGGWNGSGQGSWKGARWNFSGTLTGGSPGKWEGEVSWSGLEARKVSPRHARLGTLEGRFKARGKGFPEETAEAEGSWEVSSSTGLRLSGSGNAAKGKIHWSAQLSGENLAAEGSGFFSRHSEDAEVSWTLEADRNSLRPLSGFGHGRVSGQGRVRGARPSQRLEAAIQAAKVSFLEDFTVDRFSLAAEGSLKEHDVSWAAEAGPSTAAASGRGSWEKGVWRADWEELTLEGPFSAKAGPFRTQASPELLAIRGLVLEGDQGLRLRLDGDRKGGKLESLLVGAEGVDIAAIGAAFGHPFPVAGALSLRGAVAEGPEGLAGDFGLESAQASIYGMGPGPLAATGRLAGGRALLEKLAWEVGSSTLSASGWADLPKEEGQEGDFSFRISAPKPGLSADLPAGPLRAQGLGFSCDMTLSRSSGEFTGDGRAEVWAKTLAIPGAGWAAADVDVQLVGRGARVEVAAARAVTGGRPLKVTGGLGAKGPDLRVEAENLILIPQPGLNAEARVDIELEGTWGVPALAGNIFLTRLDYVPSRPSRKWWQFYKEIIPEVSDELPAQALSAPTTLPPLTADLKIQFDKNVWYKRGQASVELKGNLWIKKEAREPPAIHGSIETVRGSASYLGRLFRLESGRIEFSGENPPDPRLEAAAKWVDDRSQTKVKLDLTGTLGKPRLELSSVPPLEQRDIVSLLVTGRPFERAEGGAAADGEAAKRAAEQMLAAYASQKVRQTVLKPLELDVFQLRVRGGGGSEVTLGRYVTKQLFVVWDQAVGGGRSNRLRAEYSIAPGWSLEGQRTSNGHGVGDLFYKLSWK